MLYILCGVPCIRSSTHSCFYFLCVQFAAKMIPAQAQASGVNGSDGTVTIYLLDIFKIVLSPCR